MSSPVPLQGDIVADNVFFGVDAVVEVSDRARETAGGDADVADDLLRSGDDM
jgi:hypothetical protein